MLRAGLLFDCADFVYKAGMRIDHRRDYRVETTGEHRKPKAGEWYISGAIPEGYYARNDLTHDYYIARLVMVSVQKIEKVTVIARWVIMAHNHPAGPDIESWLEYRLRLIREVIRGVEHMREYPTDYQNIERTLKTTYALERVIQENRS